MSDPGAHRSHADAVGVTIVIPTYMAERATTSASTASDIEPVLGRVVLACNSRAAADAVGRSGVAFVDLGRNAGYGGGVNAAVATCERTTRGVLILNDDIVVPLASARTMRDCIDSAGTDSVVLFHGSEDIGLLGTPCASGVIARVSGLWALRRHLPRTLRGRSAPFYAAYISWPVWDRLGGFDPERYPLYFEDSDLIERAVGLGASLSAVPVELQVAVSGTSRHFARTVGALATGATNYLVHHRSWPVPLAVVAIRFALVVRAATMAVARRPAMARAAAHAAVVRRDAWAETLPPYC